MTRFTTENVLDLIGSDGDYHDGLDAFVSVIFEDGTATVELTTTEEEEAARTTDRFRVSVERIGNDQ